MSKKTHALYAGLIFAIASIFAVIGHSTAPPRAAGVPAPVAHKAKYFASAAERDAHPEKLRAAFAAAGPGQYTLTRADHHVQRLTITHQATFVPARSLGVTASPINIVGPPLPVGGWGYQDKSGNPLFSPAFTPKKEDVNQYGLGDCWFDAKLVNLADSRPDYIANVLIFPQFDTAGNVLPGLYSVCLFDIHGMQTAFNVNSEIDGIQSQPLTPNGAIWVAIIEKTAAYARSGSSDFGTLNGGEPYQAGWMFGLADSGLIPWYSAGAINDANLLQSLTAGEMPCVSTNTNAGSPFIADHCEALLKLSEQDKLSLSPPQYKFRNPWGNTAETEAQAEFYVTAAQVAANGDMDSSVNPPVVDVTPVVPPTPGPAVPGAPIVSLVGSTSTSSTATKPAIPIAWQVSKGDTVTLTFASQGGATAILRRTMAPDVPAPLNGTMSFVAAVSENITYIVTAPDGKTTFSAFLMAVK